MDPGVLTTIIALTILAAVVTFVGCVVLFRRRQHKRLERGTKENAAFSIAWEAEAPLLRASNQRNQASSHGERQDSDAMFAGSSSADVAPSAPIPLRPNRLGEIFNFPAMQYPTSYQSPGVRDTPSLDYNEEVSTQPSPLVRIYRSASGYFQAGQGRIPGADAAADPSIKGTRAGYIDLERQVPQLRVPVPKAHRAHHDLPPSPSTSTRILTRNPFRGARSTSTLENLEEALAFTPTSTRSNSSKIQRWWSSIWSDQSPWSSVLGAVMRSPQEPARPDSPDPYVRDSDVFHDSQTLQRSVPLEGNPSSVKVLYDGLGGASNSGRVRPLPTPPSEMAGRPIQGA
ncbi:hypothetical protein OBBRIDRAFT_308740 [Obba rivulosa]|uniref:Uncharacterized protein n=1 Tax=Obba rivulosa TaxID=1052685 RepID=A0A8E2DPS6_9APHY|nr:hypothetical protein OBBRIDRAFT_308740 [Obba rivulosa]